MSAFLLRPGTPADAEVLAEFAARTFHDTYAAENSAEDMRVHLQAAYGARQQGLELADRSVAIRLAFDGDELAGYAHVRLKPPPACVGDRGAVELHRFYVDRRWHGHGLAGSLMQAAFEAGRDFGGHHLWLSVWEKNPRAIAFYTKMGFADAGETVFVVGTDPQRDRVLVARLA